ncbi:MAG: phosphate acyltransferase PlsX [Clostridia bacterium]|nr:phosphate acyltransferase PlsX [Clostridia bacterium]
MKIIVDAFGGDHAPLEILKGAADAKKEYGVDIIFTGDSEKIRACASENNIDITGCEILDASQVMQMEDEPNLILKVKRDSSMGVGLDALAAGKGDAFVSAGSTAALVVGGTFIVKRIKGIKRCAIASVMPSDKGPFMLIDCGANVECKPAFLAQFAQMGSIYMGKVLGIGRPRVGLANIGVEETKGTPFVRESYALLQEERSINFIGNAEVRDIANGVADVIVADGFTGNVILKMYEGVAGMLVGNIKKMFKKNIFSMLGYLLVKGGMNEFKGKMDYKQYGGAPLLGLTAPVIKAHGSSDARAFKNAIRQAKDCCENQVVATIAAGLHTDDAAEDCM